MTQEDQNKMRWLRPAMNGDNDAVIASLLNTLPTTESLSGDDLKRMDVARNYMAELFLRGVTLQNFYMDSGLTGFAKDPAQPGMVRNPMLGGESPIYFRLWHVDKDPAAAAKAIQNILASRKSQMQEEYRGCFTLQLAIDVDNNVKDQPYALDCGLTPEAVCMEFGLNDVESVFARISEACAKLSPKAHSKLRIVLGSWAEQEYAHMCKMSLFSKRLPFKMGTEWLLFKNIHRRAGKFAWFWKIVAKRRDRHDNG